MTDDYARRQVLERERKWFEGRLATAMTGRFWGKITLVVEDGRIKKVTEERTTVPPKEDA